jgi:hypothetical protein
MPLLQDTLPFDAPRLPLGINAKRVAQMPQRNVDLPIVRANGDQFVTVKVYRPLIDRD